MTNPLNRFVSVPVNSIGSRTVSDTEIHVWRFELDAGDAVEQHMLELLSSEEKSRYEGFKFNVDRRRFAVRRGALRLILGAYAGVRASDLTFSPGMNGKPAIAFLPGDTTLSFNASSSANLGLVAISNNLPVGVDLEFLKPIDNMLEIAARFFTSDESENLTELPTNLQLRGFYQTWTSKEAVVKACSIGLSMPLDSFDVRVDPRKPAEMLQMDRTKQEPEQWSLYEIEPGDGFIGVLAAVRPGLELCGWSLDLSRTT